MSDVPGGPAMLFCPGDRPGRFEKALAAADAVILDLEDSVAPDAKTAARRNVVGALGDLDDPRLVVRVNGVRTPWFHADLAALAETPLETVMLPKSERVQDLKLLGRFGVIALCETASGILGARELAAHKRSIMLAWGGQDLSLDLFGVSLARDGQLSSSGRFARHMLRFAGAAEGVPTVDTVRTNIQDDNGLLMEARSAANLGFAAKLVIHPRQVPIVREAFVPTESEVERAREIVEAAEQPSVAARGVTVHAGEMLDEPVVELARQVLRRAQESPLR